MCVTPRLTIRPLPEGQHDGQRLQRQLLKLIGHRLALRARGGASRIGSHHAARTKLLPALGHRGSQRDGWALPAEPVQDREQSG